jgi:TRAP-type C4-dicarboxylate transport system permease small subunit
MRFLARLYDLGALACFLAVTALVSVEVVTRNLFSESIIWAEEASRFFTVWTVFLGSAGAWFRGTHITINMLPRRLYGRTYWGLKLVIEVLNSLFLAALMGGTILLMQVSGAAKTTAMEISINYLYLAVAVGGAGMVVFQVNRFIETFRGLAGKVAAPAGG